MAKKKEADKKTKKEEKTEVKVEKKVIKKQPETSVQLFSLEELADLFNTSVLQMRSMYAIRGIDKRTKLSEAEAYEKFNNIV